MSVCLLGAVVALWNQWPLAGEQRAGHGPRSPIVRLSPAQALQRATAARRGVSVQIASGLELSAWAPDGLVIDPVALDFDERGVLYATSTSRNNLPLDIRAHPSWVPLVHSLKTVAGPAGVLSARARAGAECGESMAARCQQRWVA